VYGCAVLLYPDYNHEIKIKTNECCNRLPMSVFVLNRNRVSNYKTNGYSFPPRPTRTASLAPLQPSNPQTPLPKTLVLSPSKRVRKYPAQLSGYPTSLVVRSWLAVWRPRCDDCGKERGTARDRTEVIPVLVV